MLCLYTLVLHTECAVESIISASSPWLFPRVRIGQVKLLNSPLKKSKDLIVMYCVVIKLKSAIYRSMSLSSPHKLNPEEAKKVSQFVSQSPNSDFLFDSVRGSNEVSIPLVFKISVSCLWHLPNVDYLLSKTSKRWHELYKSKSNHLLSSQILSRSHFLINVIGLLPIHSTLCSYAGRVHLPSSDVNPVWNAFFHRRLWVTSVRKPTWDLIDLSNEMIK
jgi:hypothetical protein